MYTASPYKVAIVGGIGSGKSVVSRLFRLMGVPVYDCDTEAKLLINSAPSIRQTLKAAIGEQVYGADGRLDRAFLASYMFGHPERVALVNGIVHPAVRAHFSAWAEGKEDKLVAVETAILFESGMEADVDGILIVHAPEELRLRRAMLRDGSDEQAIRRRMSNQMSADELLARAHYRICNDGTVSLIDQVRHVIEEIGEKAI